MFKHILLPSDGSELSGKAADMAIRLAKELGASLTAVHVVERYHPPFLKGDYKLPEIPALLKQRYEEETAARVERILDTIKKAAAANGVKCRAVAVRSDSPYEAIIKRAQKSACDVIVMASHGRRGLEGLLLGSETQKVLTHSAIPVLVCR